MEKVKGREKGTIVLATVKGDVHDIGKNLVDIILTNNGYKVVNLGIKQPLTNILAAAEEHRAHAVGMSGLLVKSTVVMRLRMASKFLTAFQEWQSAPGFAGTFVAAAGRWFEGAPDCPMMLDDCTASARRRTSRRSASASRAWV